MFKCQLDQSFKACSGSIFARQASEVTCSDTVSSTVLAPQPLSLLTPSEMFFGKKIDCHFALGNKRYLRVCGWRWVDLRGNEACQAHRKILLFLPPLYVFKEEIKKSIKVWKAHCNQPWSYTYSHPLPVKQVLVANADIDHRSTAAAPPDVQEEP